MLALYHFIIISVMHRFSKLQILPHAIYCKNTSKASGRATIRRRKALVPAVITVFLLQLVVRSLPLRVVILLAAIVLVVELLGSLLGLVLGLLTVDIVGTLGLGETVDFHTSKGGDGLLGELVRGWLACC